MTKEKTLAELARVARDPRNTQKVRLARAELCEVIPAPLSGLSHATMVAHTILRTEEETLQAVLTWLEQRAASRRTNSWIDGTYAADEYAKQAYETLKDFRRVFMDKKR